MKVRLSLVRFAGRELPPVCMRCGTPAAFRQDRAFSCVPATSILGHALAHLAGAFIPLLRHGPVVRLRAPLCERHRDHWDWAFRFTFRASLAFAVVTVCWCALLVATSIFAPREGDLTPRQVESLQASFYGMIALGVVWVGAVGAAQMSRIRATEVATDSVTLTGVAGEFAEAVREAQEGDHA